MNLDVSASSPTGVLTLLALRGVGPQAVERLTRRFESLRAIWEATPGDLESVPPSARAALRDRSAWENGYSRALAILSDADRHDVRVLTVADDSYPALLRDIHDRPPVLYVRGKLKAGRRAVACIGTREPSRFGEEVTRRIASALAERGWSIVSGLALGVDSLAHRAALESRAHTVAVLANGLETVYPKKNAALADDILQAGGAWVSEQPFGAPAIPRNLVQRDRLQSGMSVGTIVMQTDVIGGSMHTVRFTLMQRRLLFAPVPHGQFAVDEKSRGILALTQKTGAELRQLLDANGDYAALLEDEFRERPAAVAISSREDYDKLFSMLETAVVANGQTAAATRPQLGLF